MQRGLVLFLGIFLLSGCGNYSSETKAAREEFYSGKYSDAARALEKGAKEEGIDQLLFVLDRATALHQAADFEQSIEEFARAEKLMEQKDYTSVSAELATLFSNDKILPYKGEAFEKILVSQYQALNYLFLGKKEDALVECRRVNHKTQLFISQGYKTFTLSPMAIYLSAIMYEDNAEWNDAFVDYQQTYRLLPGLKELKLDLYRLAWRNKIFDGPLGTEHWVHEFGLTSEEQKKIKETANDPEIIVLIENGYAPEKKPHPNWQALPKYYARENKIKNAEVVVDQENQGESSLLYNVENTAIATLDEKISWIVAKKVTGVVAKEAVGYGIGKATKEPIIGDLARLGMYLADQADLRSWLTLPQDFQIFRFRGKPGKVYKVSLKLKGWQNQDLGFANSSAGKPLEKTVLFSNKKRERQFLHFRVN